ncbi:MAG: polyprenol monophosphomannose synthase [Verrucomicrobia bacterium]|nr:polyprenol monophosphomannose synthase [Verrucomicrobiota bacterium]
MSKHVVIIPTYDEKENVRPIARGIFSASPEAHVLFIDDSSPDGTGEILDAMAAEDARVFVIHKQGKQGLGRAYVTGFDWALARDYDFIFEMDADFSHDPMELPNFLDAVNSADLILGSRYINGISITNWPLSRLLLSKTAATYVRLITGMPVTDPTGGFKCFRRAVLETVDFDNALSSGYSFQVEITHSAWMHGFRIKEIPIIFEDRRSGYSKMNRDIMNEALRIVWKLALRYKFRRRPISKRTFTDNAPSQL